MKILSKASHHIILQVSILFLVALSVYFNSFDVPFQLDDIDVIVENPVIENSSKMTTIFKYDPSRFLTHLSFSLNFRWWKLDVFGFHAVNFFLHLLNTLLLYYFLRLTMRLSLKDNGGGEPKWLVPFFGALIFLTHPIQTASVTYLVQRSVLLSTSFYFAVMILYIHLRLSFRWNVYFWFWCFACLGVMTKPIFITVPLTILLYEWCFLKEIPKRKILFISLPLIGIVVAVPILLMSFFLGATFESFTLSKIMYATRVSLDIPRGTYLLTQFGIIVKYIFLLFCPLNQNVYYTLPLSKSIFDFRVLFSFLLLLGLIVYAIYSGRKKPLISFCILWFFILMIPESSIFPLPDLMFEHRLYMGVACFGVILTQVLWTFTSDLKRCYVYLWIIVVGLSILTYSRNILWSDPFLILEDALAKGKDKSRGHNNLGILYEREGLLQEALEHFQKATDVNSHSLSALNNMGRIYAKTDRLQEANQAFRNALEIDPGYFDANVNLGDLYYQQGEWLNAIAQYEKAITIRSFAYYPYYRIGKVYWNNNEFAKAQKYFKLAMHYNPYSMDSQYALANIYLEQDQYEQAISLYEQIIALNPRYGAAYNTMGITFAKQGQWRQAERYFYKALELNPDDVTIMRNLSQIHRNQGNDQKANFYADLVRKGEK